MKVLQLISSIGYFGAENVMFELAKALPANEYKPYIGIIGKPDNFPKGIELKYFPSQGKLDLRIVFKIRQYLKVNKIDIMHSHNYKSNFYGFLAAFNLDIKKIATCHNWLGNGRKMRFYELLDKLILRKFNKIIAVSESLKEEILNSGIKQEKVEVIRNGVDTSRFTNVNGQQKLRDSLNIKENDRIVGTVGRLSPEKGHIYLMQAFKRTLAGFPNLKLLIVGDGQLRNSLESEAKKLDIEEQVIFAGKRNDIPDMLGIMDIFTLPSLLEAMPVSLLEAMAAGKPVIATKVGEIPKMVKDGYSGLLVEQANINQLSNAITLLLNDRNKAAFIGKNGFNRVKDEFSSSKMADEYIKAYKSLWHNPKIIQVEIAGKGGICHYTYNLSQALGKIEKIKLVTGINYELENKDRNFELREAFNRFKTSPLSILKLITQLRDKDVDIVHFQLSQHPFFILLLCYLTKFLTNKKIIVTAHNVFSHEERPGERIIYQKIYNLADKIIVHSWSSQIELEQHFGKLGDKLNVIPHGNYALFNEREANAALPENSATILFFGYIREYKGLMYLIRALKLVKEKIPQVKLYIVGKPVEDFEPYQKEIDNLGLQSNVEVDLSYVHFDRFNEYFCRANLVALPYLNIYQSGVLHLAYAFGRPVVATSVGGLKEAVDDGKSGFLVPPGDVHSLAEKITMVLSNPGLQQEMSKYSFNLAKTKFSWDSIAKKTLELYEAALNSI